MDKVITICEWYDGPVLGLATCSDELVVYVRVFSEENDEWTNEYELLSVSDSDISVMLDEWQLWVDSIYHRTKYDYSLKLYINEIVENKTDYKRKRKYARFWGSFDKGYIPRNYYVEWSDK